MQAKVRKVVIIMTDEFQLKLKLNFCIDHYQYVLKLETGKYRKQKVPCF